MFNIQWSKGPLNIIMGRRKLMLAKRHFLDRYVSVFNFKIFSLSFETGFALAYFDCNTNCTAGDLKIVSVSL